MAGYSKQWCDIWDLEMPYDFDIDKISKDLYSDRYYPITCEGIGFINIHKDRYDNIWLGFSGANPDTTYWIRLNTVLIAEKKKANENSNLQRHSQQATTNKTP
jgi:hypothetical protein